VRAILKKKESINVYEKLVCFWDKLENNLITVMINRPDKHNNIINTQEISLKVKAYSVKKKITFEKILTNEPFLYKLQRHKKINLKSLREFFLGLKGIFLKYIINHIYR